MSILVVKLRYRCLLKVLNNMNQFFSFTFLKAYVDKNINETESFPSARDVIGDCPSNHQNDLIQNRSIASFSF